MKNGYTLIELILVLAVVSILLLVSVVKVDIKKFKLEAEAKVMYSDIRYVKLMTMSEGGSYRFIFSENGYQVNKGVKRIKTVKIDKEFKIIDNFKRNEIAFNYSGAIRSQGGTITLLNKKNKERFEITIMPCSGRIFLRKGEI